jgi:limonene-1,2-epoxide hydrolase
MKQLIVLFVISTGLFACTSSVDKKENESLAVAKRYIAAVESNDLKTMDSLLADNYMGYGPSVGDSTNKTDALASWKYNSEQLYESVTYTRQQSLAVIVKENEEAAAGNWVSNWAYLTIKYRDGRGTANLWVNAAYRIENGKIVHSRTFYNESDVLRQLGYGLVAGKGSSQ